MFDIGFAELVIIGVVALIVIGPERLPGAIRTLSAWLNRFRRSFNEIKQEVQQELHNDAVMRELKQLRDSGEDLRREAQSLKENLSDELAPPPERVDTSGSAAKTSPPDAADRTQPDSAPERPAPADATERAGEHAARQEPPAESNSGDPSRAVGSTDEKPTPAASTPIRE